MLISPTEALHLLIYYKYLLIFPIAVVEGPIIIIISGLLVSLGLLSAPVAYIVLVVADSTGDSLYYLIGKYWKSSPRIKKYASFLGYNEKSEEFLENHFKKHKIKTFLIAKVSHGIGGSIQIASGIAGVKYREFLPVSLLGTIPKTLALMTIGFYIGESYEKIDGYLRHIALSVIILAIVLLLYFTSNKITKGFFKRKELSGQDVDRK